MKSNNFDRSKCEKYEEMLSFYIDNELSEADKAALETHLSSCADCRAAHEDLREMLGALNGLEELDLP
ncbi:MAG: zf-HC2 domain-containing protein, partial [Clostridiales bacterium]|nr:zf-HC2 domain-containing protein [Clostridiales bacterium]